MTSLTGESSTPRPDYSGVAAPPSIESTRRHIAATVCRAAIARYEEARRRFEEARIRSGDDASLEAWQNIALGSLEEASRCLVCGILQWRPGPTSWMAWTHSKVVQRPRGIAHGGKLYLALPDSSDRDEMLEDPARFEDRGGERESSDKMHLAVLDLADVVDLGAILGTEPASGGSAPGA